MPRTWRGTARSDWRRAAAAVFRADEPRHTQLPRPKRREKKRGAWAGACCCGAPWRWTYHAGGGGALNACGGSGSCGNDVAGSTAWIGGSGYAGFCA